VKEVFGHLTDLAENSLQRIVRLSLAPTLELPGYQQEGWVAVQHYADRSWDEVFALWRLLNLHLTHVIAHLKKEHLGHVWRFERERGSDARIHHRRLRDAFAAPFEDVAAIRVAIETRVLTPIFP
jgi:hypothetical protein